MMGSIAEMVTSRVASYHGIKYRENKSYYRRCDASNKISAIGKVDALYLTANLLSLYETGASIRVAVEAALPRKRRQQHVKMKRHSPDARRLRSASPSRDCRASQATPPDAALPIMARHYGCFALPMR